jgi:hypothetical protein
VPAAYIEGVVAAAAGPGAVAEVGEVSSRAAGLVLLVA